VGPALFASKFGRREFRFGWVLLLWLAAGYVEWVLSLVLTIGQSGSRAVMAMYVAAVLILSLVRPLWMAIVGLGLLGGIAILSWALTTNWHGLWVRNAHVTHEPVQLDWFVVKGILVSAAPAVVIAWRIGRIQPEPRRIWFSGLVGVWLPLVVSVAMASLATQAGANLYWRPSLFRGFNWALLGPHGRLEHGVQVLVCWTFLLPAIVCMISLRHLVPAWTRREKIWLVPIAAGLLVCGWTSVFASYEGIHYDFSTPTHEYWAGSLVLLGAAAGAYSMWGRASK
jgi:hypothetical protein